MADFLRIPGYTFAYWVPASFIDNYEKYPSLGSMITISSLNKTGDNEKYLRCWWEIEEKEIGKKWIFYSKGGDFRRYYGNIDVVIDWSDTARWFYKNNKTSNLIPEEFWYKEGITYSAVTSRGTGFRYLPVNNRGKLLEILALLNSSTATYYFNVMNPSINLQTNLIQCHKRRGTLSDKDVLKLNEIGRKADVTKALLAGIQILLENYQLATIYLEQLDELDRKEFENYPIYNLMKQET